LTHLIRCYKLEASNGNDIETKANDNDNGVFFYIEIRNKGNTFDSKQIIFEAKQIHKIEQKLFSKRSQHV
jgi:hypothetical protein